MMKHEFEERIGKQISSEEYSEIIEPVYMHYPEDEACNKDTYARLYLEFGIRIFEDMLPRAKQVIEFENKIREAKKLIEKYDKEIKEL